LRAAGFDWLAGITRSKRARKMARGSDMPRNRIWRGQGAAKTDLRLSPCHL